MSFTAARRCSDQVHSTYCTSVEYPMAMAKVAQTITASARLPGKV